MSELAHYYSNFSASAGWHFDPTLCVCRGNGRVLSEVDTLHECRYHRGFIYDDDSNEPMDPETEAKVNAHNAALKLQHKRDAFRTYRNLGRAIMGRAFDVQVALFRGDAQLDTPDGWLCAACHVYEEVALR